jgi:hypothetical protein
MIAFLVGCVLASTHNIAKMTRRRAFAQVHTLHFYVDLGFRLLENQVAEALGRHIGGGGGRPGLESHTGDGALHSYGPGSP